jgi:hypothetical protein
VGYDCAITTTGSSANDGARAAPNERVAIQESKMDGSFAFFFSLFLFILSFFTRCCCCSRFSQLLTLEFWAGATPLRGISLAGVVLLLFIFWSDYR